MAEQSSAHGNFYWNELMTRDAEKAKKFYADVIGWGFDGMEMPDGTYWVAKKMGYFGDLNIDIQPGPSDVTATVKFVDVGQADMGFPSPGVFSFAIENGMALKSCFHEAAADGFSTGLSVGALTRLASRLLSLACASPGVGRLGNW